MIAQLRVIFTTAFAPWVAAIGGVLAAVVNGFSRIPFWIGDPLLTAEWWEASFYLLAIPTCAMLAFDTAAQTGPGATSVLSTGRFTARWRAQLLAVTWVLSVLPTFAAFVYFSLQFEDFRYTAHTPYLHMGGALLGVLLIYVASMCIGVAASKYIALPLGAIVGLVAALSSFSDGIRVIDFGGSTGPLTLLDYRPGLVGQRFSLLLIAALIGVIVLLRALQPTLRARIGAGIFAGVIAAALVGVMGNTTPRLVPSGPTSVTCTPDEHDLWVCLSQGHERFRGPVTVGFQQQWVALQNAGIELPRCLSDVPATMPPEASTDTCMTVPASASIWSDLHNWHFPNDILVNAALGGPLCPGEEDESTAAGRALAQIRIETMQELDAILADPATASSEAAARVNSALTQLQQCQPAP